MLTMTETLIYKGDSMIDLSFLKYGDCLVHLEKKGFDPIGAFIGMFSFNSKRIKRKAVHIAWFIGMEAGVPMELGHHAQTNIYVAPIPDSQWDNIVVLRYLPNNKGLSKDVYERVFAEILRSKGTKKGEYDALSFPSMFLRSVIGKLMKNKMFRKGKPIFNDLVKTVCSSLVPTVIFEIENLHMFSNVHYASVIPEDYLDNKSFKIMYKPKD